MHRFSFYLIVLVSTTCCSFSFATNPSSGLKDSITELESSTQLIVVTTPSWQSVAGTIICFERANTKALWEKIGTPEKVVVGSQGMAWGIGLHGMTPADGPSKVEGDCCAPAGVFFLGDAFGYDSLQQVAINHITYHQLSENDEGVDDPDSRYYNRIVDASTVAFKDWTSFETMRRSDELYRLGIVVEHNWQNIPGKGSCIFMHVWPGPSLGTAGCTAMAYDDLNKILHWLDKDKKPLLVQLPELEYKKWTSFWKLP